MTLCLTLRPGVIAVDTPHTVFLALVGIEGSKAKDYRTFTIETRKVPVTR
jgi:hypothetical protein